MPKFNASVAVSRADSTQLLKMLSLDETTPDEWQTEDLAAMVQHQMSAPLTFDLSTVATQSRLEAKTRDTTLTDAAAERITTFRDLLFRKEPPLELLRLSKEFFKPRTEACKEGSAEWQVAFLFYLTSILAAGEDHAKISKLTPSQLLKGINWALERTWLDARMQELLVHARQRLQAKAAH